MIRYDNHFRLHKQCQGNLSQDSSEREEDSRYGNSICYGNSIMRTLRHKNSSSHFYNSHDLSFLSLLEDSPLNVNVLYPSLSHMPLHEATSWTRDNISSTAAGSGTNSLRPPNITHIQGALFSPIQAPQLSVPVQSHWAPICSGQLSLWVCLGQYFLGPVAHIITFPSL